MINTIDGILEAAKGGKTGVIAVAAAHDEPVIEAVVEAVSYTHLRRARSPIWKSTWSTS